MRALGLLATASWVGAASFGVACDAACGASGPHEGAGESLREAPPTLGEVAVEPYEGLSGWTLDGDGQLWAIPERQRALLPLGRELAPGGEGASRLALGEHAAVPLQGVPDGLDTEAIAWLGDKRFVLGTESPKAAALDALLFVELRDHEAVVTEQVDVDYAPWGLVGEGNHGIEGVCHAGGRVVVAIERVREETRARLAPVGVFDPRTRKWMHHWLVLSSDSGKLSALDCQANADGDIVALAVERHFGVSRLLRFRIPQANAGAADMSSVFAADVLFDLAGLIDPLPNFEGLVWRDQEVWLLSDNHYGRRTGPTVMLRLPLADVPRLPAK